MHRVLKSLCAAAALAGLLLLGGCTRQPSGADASAFAPDDGSRLVVYTSHKEEVYRPIIKEFEERTGIWVEVVTGGTNELLERIRDGGGQPACDVIFGGGAESLMVYSDCLEPYRAAEADSLRAGLRGSGDLWTPFSSLPVVIVYNTKLVAPGQIRGWADLFDVRWQGRIAFADPSVSGSSYTAAVTMLSCLPGSPWDNLAAFAENLGGNVQSDSGNVVSAVAGGSCVVGVTLEETALKRIAAGDDIAIIYPQEGTSNQPDGVALIKGAAHADNARAFIDFTLSADVQSILGAFCRRPVRDDVPERDGLTPLGDIRLINYNVSYASRIKEEFLSRWADLSREGEA